MNINLKGISKKGKERLKRDGPNNWIIMQESGSVAFSPEPGPWLLLGKNDDVGKMRWVKMTGDKDFEIV